jgi:hypothetical protein
LKVYFGQELVVDVNLAETSYTPSASIELGSFTWRVSVEGENSATMFSEIYSFEIIDFAWGGF